jgi:RNA methyltransferase, TrmH family
MIPVNKLAKLAPRHRMRKMALVLGELQRGLMAGTELEIPVFRYAEGLSKLLLADDAAAEAVLAAANTLTELCGKMAGKGEHQRYEFLSAVDSLRHALIAATGQAPADWDLIDPRTGLPDPRTRRVCPGIRAYLEDLRSPFNVGSVFRTADAFGLEELILSPSCADPFHPRAIRSAMGAVDLVPWRRATLGSLSGEAPMFAVELGGEGIEDFSFPVKGIAVFGSEELGVSREARDTCELGTVSIPMSGAKGSLNVAVAFGIIMYAWTRSLGVP